VTQIDLSNDLSIPQTAEMLREITRAGNSQDVLLTFMHRYRKIRPVDAFMGVRPEPGRPGAYRILYSYCSEEGWMDRQPRDVDPAAIAKLPVYEGGFVAEMIADPTPKYVYDVDFSGDPALDDLTDVLHAVMVLPLFEGDKVEEWVFSFSTRNEPAAIEEISRALLTSNLLAAANRNLDSLQTIRRLHSQMRDQLDQVARVQQSLLPAMLPDIPGVEISTSYLTSDLAGGDYYDFFALPGGRWGVLVADVSGHGPAAATVMAMLHAILHAYSPMSDPAAAIDPAAVMEFANERLLAAGLEGAFVTAFFAVFDPIGGEFVYANAGHPPPIIKLANGQLRELNESASLPLGIDRPLNAVSVTTTIGQQDTVIMYTDGITEAFSPSGVMFDTERLEAALDNCSGAPDCVVESVHAALFAHVGSATRADDQTLVAMRFHGVCIV
jgi:sigma-B regulation protein RsbU (phosphoserine phosphatase)